MQILSPADGDSFAQPYAKIEGTAVDSTGVSSLWVNGVEASTTDGYANWTAYLPLSLGANTIVVEAEDVLGNTDPEADSIEVDYEDACIDGVTALYTFDEFSGSTIEDRSNSGVNLTGIGVERLATTELGNVGVFDGTAYARALSQTANSPTGSFSYDLWFARDGATSDWQALVNKGYYWGSYSVFMYSTNLYVGMMDSTGQVYYVTFNGLFDGDWHHLAVTYDQGTLSAYLDGVLQASTPVGSTPWQDTYELSLGRYVTDNSLYFSGQLDQFRLWDSALSSATVLRLYNQGEACSLGSNLAETGVANAGSSYSQAYRGSKVIDGKVDESDWNTFSYWLTPDYNSGFVDVEVPDTIGLTQVRLLNTHNGPYYDRAFAKYTLWASSTGQFSGEEELLATGTGDIESLLSWTTHTLTDPVEAKVIRFQINDYSGYGGGLNELQIRGQSSERSPAPSRTTSTSPEVKSRIVVSLPISSSPRSRTRSRPWP